MSDSEKPLPKPPKTPFGKKRMSEEEQEGQAPLMADQMAMAAATGNLDRFMQQNIPDNEHARKLAMMMMGMTGMMPPGAFPGKSAEAMQPPPAAAQPEQSGEAAPETEVPEDVRQAIMSGNMEELKGLLIREHQRRTGSIISEVPPAPEAEAGFNTAPSGIEKEILDEMIRIAAANSVTLDWLIMRALKVFIQEYQKTGRL
ncbi:MAG: hypothetical protein HZB62_11835 [Nitrospirae bacterium]|nr:hypothetical protein [Nitrospirota bacterium]